MATKWLPNLEFAKRQVSEAVLRQMLDFMAKDPEKNIMQLLKLGKMLARQGNHQRQINMVENYLANNGAIRKFVTSLLRDTDPYVLKKLAYNWFVNSALLGIPKQREQSERLGFNVPHFILVDPTSACNLRCEGCWAGKYQRGPKMNFERLDRLCEEAKELGIYWIVFSGGEPLMYKRLFELVKKHDDMAFMAYTNGTLIDEEMADRIVEVGNFTPAISMEGWKESTDRRRGEGVFDKITRAMDLLKERGAIFGVSLTATRENVQEIVSDDFIDFLVDKGVRYGWIFHYIPIGHNPNTDLMLTPEQRAYLARQTWHIRIHRSLMLADFWNDGELTGGCIAGGRRYFHITADGTVEPCAFVHFSVENINDKSLVEVLQSPLFKAFQKRQPFCENHLRPCPLIDNPAALRDIVAESGAKPTHEGAETVLGGDIGAFLDRRSAEWAEKVEKEFGGGREVGESEADPEGKAESKNLQESLQEEGLKKVENI